jgi:hypothetical protein
LIAVVALSQSADAPGAQQTLKDLEAREHSHERRHADQDDCE